MSALVPVTLRPRIGRLDVVHRQVTAGASLADMAAGFADDMPPEFWTLGVALIDDAAMVEPQHWHLVRPRAGHRVHFVLSPGKGGNTLQILATVAVVAAQAFAYSIPGIGPFLSAAIGIGGAMLIGSLAPKQGAATPAKAPKQLGESGFSDNVLGPYEQVPTVLGVRRVPARFLAPPLTEYEGVNATGIAIIALAGRHEIRDTLVDGNPAESLTENIREGDISDLDPTIYTTAKWQEAGMPMSRHNLKVDDDRAYSIHHDVGTDEANINDMPKFHYFRLGRRKLPNRIVIDLLFDQGLYRTDSATLHAGVAFQVAFIKEGASSIYLPQVHVRGSYEEPLRAKLILDFSTDPGGLTAPHSGHLWHLAFASTDEQELAGRPAHSYYSTANAASHVGVSGYDVCTIYVPPESISLTSDYRLGVKIGYGYWHARINTATNYYTSFLGGSVYPVWFEYQPYFTELNNDYLVSERQRTVQSHCTIESVTREYDTEAVVPDGIATYEIQTKNQRVDRITFLAGRYVDKRWNGSAWVAEPHVSSNPAELVYDLLTNASAALLSRPIAAALVDGDGLGEWADYCSENFLECNAYIEGGTVEEVLPILFQAGHAYLKRSQKWGVYIEKDRTAESPVQVFSPRNSRGFTAEKSYEHKPHGLRVTYDDEDDDYQTRSDFVVYAPGYTAENATLFETAHYKGITTEWAAQARAELDLAIIYYRDRTYSLETDARYLVSPRGSLVGVSHYVLDAAHGFAAIREVQRQTIDGVTKITGLILDTDLDMQAGTTGIAISTNSGEVVSAQAVRPGRARQITFSTPLTEDTSIEEGCTITSGAVSEEFLYCIVDDIQPAADGMARLILVDEAPEIHGATRAGGDLYASPDLYAETDLYNLNQ